MGIVKMIEARIRRLDHDIFALKGLKTLDAAVEVLKIGKAKEELKEVLKDLEDLKKIEEA